MPQFYGPTLKKLPAYMNPPEFKIFISHVISPHHKLAFMLAYGSGLRISEVLNLKKEDIDFTSKKIMVRQGKGSKDRVVPLPKGFAESWLRLIPIDCGVRALQIAFKECYKRSGLQKQGMHFHSLRHSFAVQCMEVGIPLNQLQVLLGHNNISTTGIYTQINPKDALDSYERLWK